MTHENANSNSKNKIIKRTCQCLLTTALVIPALTSVSYATQVDNDMENHIKQHVEQQVTQQNNGVSNSPLNKTEGKTQDRTVTTNKEQEKPSQKDDTKKESVVSELLTDSEISNIKKQAADKGYEFTDLMVNKLKAELEKIKDDADFASKKISLITKAVDDNQPSKLDVSAELDRTAVTSDGQDREADTEPPKMMNNGHYSTSPKGDPTALDGYTLPYDSYMGDPNGKQGKNKSGWFVTYKTIDNSGKIKDFYLEKQPSGSEFEKFVKGVDDIKEALKYEDDNSKGVNKKFYMITDNKASVGKNEIKLVSIDQNGNKLTITNYLNVKTYLPAASGKIVAILGQSEDITEEQIKAALGIYYKAYDDDNARNSIIEEVKNNKKDDLVYGNIEKYKPQGTTYTLKEKPKFDKVGTTNVTALVKYKDIDNKEITEEVQVPLEVLDKEAPLLHNGGKESGRGQKGKLDDATFSPIFMGEENGRINYDKGKNFYTYKAIDNSGTIVELKAEGLPEGTTLEEFKKGVDDIIQATKFGGNDENCVAKKLWVTATDKAKEGTYSFTVTTKDPSGNTTTVTNKIEVRVYVPAAIKELQAEIYEKDYENKLKPEDGIGVYHKTHDNENQRAAIVNAIKEAIAKAREARKTTDATFENVVDKKGYLPDGTTFEWKLREGNTDLNLHKTGLTFRRVTVKYKDKNGDDVVQLVTVPINVKDTKAPIIWRAKLNTGVAPDSESQLNGKDFVGYAAFIGDDNSLGFTYRTGDNSGQIKSFTQEGAPIGTVFEGAENKGLDANGDRTKLAFSTDEQMLARALKIKATNENKVGDYVITITSTDNLGENGGNKTVVKNTINVRTYLPVAAKELSLEKGEDATNLQAKDYIGAYLEKYDTKIGKNDARTKAQVKADIDNNNIDKNKISADKDKYFPTQGTTYEWVTAPNTNQEPGNYTAVAKVIFTDKNGNKVEETVNIPYTVKPSTKPINPTVEQKEDKVTVSPANGDTNTKKLEIKYTDKDGNPVTVTATKEDSGWKVTPDVDGVKVDENGNVTIENSKVQPGSDVSVVAKNDNKQSEPTSATTSPKSPEVGTNDKGDVTVKPSDKADSLEIKYTPEGEGTTEKTVTAKKDDQGKWKFEGDATGLEINEDTGAVTIKKGTAKEKQPVKATSKTKNSKPSTESTITVPDKTAPTAPQVDLAGDNSGDVTITPANDDTSKVTITYTDKDGQPKTVTATKGNDDKWTVPAESGLKVSEDGKTITVPKAITQDETEVTAKATDENNNNSGDVTVKVPDKTAPEKPTVEVDDKTGNITVKAPEDNDIKTVEIKYTDKEGQPKTVTATKGDDGKWRIEPNDSAVKFKDGKFTVPADQVSPGTKVNVSSIDKSGNKAEKDQDSKPSKPTIAENDDKAIEITPQGDVEKVKIKYTPADGSEEKEIVAKKKADGTGWEIENAPQGISVDNTGTVKFDKGVAKENTPIKASSIKGDSNSSLENELQVPDHTPPESSKVTVNDQNGNFEITPPEKDADKITITYTNENDEKETVTVTKDEQGKWKVAPENSGVKIDEQTGKIIIVPAGNVWPGTTVKIETEDKAGNKATPAEQKAKLEAPEVKRDKDSGDVTVNPSHGAKTVEITYTPAKDGKPEQNEKTVKVVRNDDGTWKFDGIDGTKDEQTGEIKTDTGLVLDSKTGFVTILKGNAAEKTLVKAKSVVGSENSLESKAEVPDKTAPEVPKVTAKDGGRVDISDPSSLKGEPTKVTVKYTAPNGEKKTAELTKGKNGQWSTSSTDLVYDNVTGNYYLPKDKVKGGSEVSVVAEDNSGNKTDANNKVTTAPEAPKLEQADDGAVTVTPPAEGAKSLELIYKDKDGKDKTVKLTKDDAGWKVDGENPDGVTVEDGKVKIPAENVQKGSVVIAKASNDKNVSSEVGSTTTKPEVPTVTENEKSKDITVTPPANADSVEITYTPNGSDEEKTLTITKGTDGKWKLPDGETELTIDDKGVVTIAKGKAKEKSDVKVTSKVKKKVPANVEKDKNGAVTVTPPQNAKTVEITYTPAGATEAKTVVLTKGEDETWKLPAGVNDLVITNKGLVTIQSDKLTPNTPVTAIAKTADELKSEEKTQKVADLTPPAKPEVNTDEKTGDVTVKVPTEDDAQTLTITYKDPQTGKDKTVTVKKSAQGWTVDGENPDGVTVEDGKVKIPADKVQKGTSVIAKATDDSNNTSDPEVITTRPEAPKVTADKDSGDVKVEPPKNAEKMEIKYTPKDATEPKTVVVTKDADGKWKLPDGEKDLTIDENGVVTIAKGKAKEKSDVKVTSKVTKEVSSKVEKDKNGAVTVTPPQNAKTVEITYTPAGATEAKTVVVTKDADGKWKLPDGEKDLTINENGVVTIQSDKLKENTPVTAIAKTTDEVSSEEKTQGVPDITAPSAPTVTASDDGKLTIQPPKDDDVKTVEVSYFGKDGKQKTATATKGDDGNWTISGDSDRITVDKNGVITIEEATTQANSEVTVTAKDKAENASKPAKAKAKTLADRTQIKLPFRTSVVSVYELRDSEIEEVIKAIQDKNKDENGNSTLPEGTKIEVDKKGNATIKFKDGSSIVIESEKLVKNKYFGTTTDESSNGNDAQTLDKSQLQTEVDKENSVKDSDNYKNADKSKKDAYDKALQEGKKVLDKKDATQSEVDKAKSQLEKAKSELNGKNESGDNKPSGDKKPSDDNKQNKVDKKPLEKETNNSIATKETKKYKNADKDKKYNYEKALKKAKEVLANKKATQEEINKALANLEKAKAQLNGKEVANSPSKRAKKLPKAGSTAETFTLSIAGLLSAAGAFFGLKKKDEDR